MYLPYAYSVYSTFPTVSPRSSHVKMNIAHTCGSPVRSQSLGYSSTYHSRTSRCRSTSIVQARLYAGHDKHVSFPVVGGGLGYGRRRYTLPPMPLFFELLRTQNDATAIEMAPHGSLIRRTYLMVRLSKFP